MIWPIPSPRLRKSIETRLVNLAEYHFLTRLGAAALAAGVYCLSGGALFILLAYSLDEPASPLIFGVLYSTAFILLTLLTYRLSPKDPLQAYRDAEFARTGTHPTANRLSMPRWQRIVLFGPLITVLAFRRIVEQPPPRDAETLETALRMLPALHDPLPLSRAEEAGIGNPEAVRRATVLLNALGLTDLIRAPDGELLLCPRSAAAKLLRGDDEE